MFHPILTISRECGSGGHSIGVAVSKALDIPLYDSEIIDLMAKRTNLAKEYLASQEDLFGPGYATRMANPFSTGASLPDEVQLMLTKLILELVEQGPCVIIGRCADYILRNRPNCLHAFIHAPMEFKVNRAMYDAQYRFLDHQDVARMNDVQRRTYLANRLAKRDKNRSRYYEFYTGRTWGDYKNYDICINSGRWGIEGSTRLLSLCYGQVQAEFSQTYVERSEEDDE